MSVETEAWNLKTKIGIAVGLFVIALLPRIFGLSLFLTSDEPLWLTRSIFFSEALLTGNLAETLQTGHPGVTTMWSGSLGLGLAYFSQEQPAASFLDFLQTLPHKPDRVVVSLVQWVRLPTVMLAALCVAMLYVLGANLMGDSIALVAALLLAFDPLFLAHSRTLHHDALATIFMSLSVLSLLNYSVSQKFAAKFYLLLSAVLAGLALLSKGTSLVLFAFAALFLAWLWVARKQAFKTVFLAGLIWLGVAVAVFVTFWPALWVIPGQVLHEVFDWVISSTNADDEVISATALTWDEQILELGVLFYPANWLLKSTLLSVAGLIALIGWWRTQKNQARRWVVAWSIIFALLLTVMLTIGDKRDGRYLLPIYPSLWLVTAAGLMWLARWILDSRFFSSRGDTRIGYFNLITIMKVCLATIFVILLLLFSLPWYPYYHSYYNPIIRGSWLAPHLIKVGWGEGMEQAAAYLNQQPKADQLVVATSYAENLLPFFAGKSVKHHQGEPSDYVLNYVRQIQNGYPYPEYWQYYKAREPVFQLAVDGIDYLWLYQESSLIQVRDTFFGSDLELKGYTVNTRLLEPGKTAQVTLIWRVGEIKPIDTMVQMQLVDGQGNIWGEASPGPVLDPAGPSHVEGHYQLAVSPDAPRFDGQLQLEVIDSNGQSLGEATVGQIPVRQTSLPPTAVTLPSQNLADQISLIGYQVNAATFAPGDSIEVTLYWQAQLPINFDFTVFTHLIGPDGRNQGQHDAQPINGQLPTSQWTVGEVVADLHSFTVAPEAPPGNYQVIVGMYRWDTGERLPVYSDVNNDQTAITLTSVMVE